MDTGCTSNVVLITPQKIFCANAGDSRSILVSKSTTVTELSHDHKPGNTDEEARINAAGHFVSDDRVDGNLALSRAFGDFQYKDQKNKKPDEQAVTAMPDIITHNRTANDRFIICACDGIWDCLTNEDAAKKMAEKLDSKPPAPDAFHVPVAEMLDEILAKDTETGIGTDNMTAILIQLN